MKTESKYAASTSMFQASASGLLDSTLTVKIVGLKEKKAYDLWSDLTKRIAAVCKVFDTTDPQSEASVLNASRVDIETSPELKEALNACEAYLIKTGELFNINRKDDKIDFSSFIKGRLMRELISAVKKSGAKDAILDFGREIVWAIGNQPYSKGWQISLIDPETDDELTEIEVSSKTVAISWQGSSARVISAKDALDAHVYSQIYDNATPNQRKDIEAALGVISVENYD